MYAHVVDGAGYFKSKWCVRELFIALCSTDTTVIPIYLEAGVADMAGTHEWLGDVFGPTLEQREEARKCEAIFNRKVRLPTCPPPWAHAAHADAAGRSCLRSSACPS